MKTFLLGLRSALLAAAFAFGGCKEPSPASSGAKALPAKVADAKPDPARERANATLKTQERAMADALAKATATAEAEMARIRKAPREEVAPGKLPGKDDYKELASALDRAETAAARMKKASAITTAEAAASLLDAVTLAEVDFQKAANAFGEKYPKLAGSPNSPKPLQALLARADRIHIEFGKNSEAMEALFKRFESDPLFKAAIERAKKARLESN